MNALPYFVVAHIPVLRAVSYSERVEPFFFLGPSGCVGCVFCLSLQVFLWHAYPVPAAFVFLVSSDGQLLALVAFWIFKQVFKLLIT